MEKSLMKRGLQYFTENIMEDCQVLYEICQYLNQFKISLQK